MKLLSYKEKLALGFLLLLITTTTVLVSFRHSSFELRKQALETACYLLLFDGKNNQEAGPIGATIGPNGLCKGALGEEYSSWYLSREEALADKQTANYPCKVFPDKEASCNVDPTTVGKKLCVGGPTSEYILCLHEQSSKITKISGPNPIAADSVPTPTTASAPTATPTPVSAAGNACQLLVFDGQTDQEANPIGARIGASGLCTGALGEEYSSWYLSREEALADKQTANYPCKVFPDKEASCQINSNTVGKKICAGGPSSEYIWCIHPSSNQVLKLSGPNPVSAESTPTPTAQPAEPCAGSDRTDLNCDDKIDLKDHEIMLQNLGAEGEEKRADINKDLVVDLKDYSILLNKLDVL